MAEHEPTSDSFISVPNETSKKTEYNQIKNIILVGAGFLGSHFVDALCRYSCAANYTDKITLEIWDGSEADTIRNPVNQYPTPFEAGINKSILAKDHAEKFGIESIAWSKNLAMYDLTSVNCGRALVVDCVDDLKTRKGIGKAARLGIIDAALHLGLSMGGLGMVEWSSRDKQPFSLEYADENTEEVELPPCQLAINRLTGIILSSIGAALALRYIGCPIDFTELGLKAPCEGDMPDVPMVLALGTSSFYATPPQIYIEKRKKYNAEWLQLQQLSVSG